MECNVPTDIVFSFTGFALRGGKTGPHADGWGLALYEGRFAHLFLEPRPACDSPLAGYLQQNPMKTLLAIAHVRQRTRGRVSIENTHPFARVLWGRHWVFAHNGTLPRVKRRKLGAVTPIGYTDSEYAFCWLLEGLRTSFRDGYPRRVKDLWEAVAALGGELGEDGRFNFLLADGRHLFARCGTRLHHIVRRAPFGRATLQDTDLQVDFTQLTTPKDRVAVVATNPLTRDETWEAAEPGTLWVFDHGQLRATLPSVASPQKRARSRTVMPRRGALPR